MLSIISAMAEIPEWQVHHASVYHTYEVEAADHLSMGVSLYIPLDPNHRNEGEFRIAILGGDEEEVCVPAIDVYHVLPQEVAGTMLHFSFSSMKTLLPGNSTSCPWQDANTLIRKFAYTNLCADSRLGIDFPAPCGYLSLHFHNQTVRP
jgi:hypothetical protein